MSRTHLRAISFRAFTAHMNSVSHTLRFLVVSISMFKAVEIRGGPLSRADGEVQYATLPQTLRAMSSHLACIAGGVSAMSWPRCARIVL